MNNRNILKTYMLFMQVLGMLQFDSTKCLQYTIEKTDIIDIQSNNNGLMFSIHPAVHILLDKAGIQPVTVYEITIRNAIESSHYVFDKFGGLWQINEQFELKLFNLPPVTQEDDKKREDNHQTNHKQLMIRPQNKNICMSNDQTQYEIIMREVITNKSVPSLEKIALMNYLTQLILTNKKGIIEETYFTTILFTNILPFLNSYGIMHKSQLTPSQLQIIAPYANKILYIKPCIYPQKCLLIIDTQGQLWKLAEKEKKEDNQKDKDILELTRLIIPELQNNNIEEHPIISCTYSIERSDKKDKENLIILTITQIDKNGVITKSSYRSSDWSANAKVTTQHYTTISY